MRQDILRFILKRLVFSLSIILIIAICLPVLWITVGQEWYLEWKYGNDPEIYAAMKTQMEKDIAHKGYWRRVWWVVLPGTAVILGSVFVVAIAWSKLKKASVHTYEIGDSKLVVHEKDLSLAAPLGMGLVSAKQLEHLNRGIEKGAEKASEIYAKIGNTAAKQAQSLVDKHTQIEQAMLPAGHIPTFQELLAAEEIVSGKPMILGYENGVPRRGSFLDIYSTAIAGESGSGKTSTMLFLIGSGIIANKVRFYGIDPHYPHPKSLGFKTKSLWEAGLMQVAACKDDTLNILIEVEHIIDNRLKQIDTDMTPVVLVIDELAFLSKTSIGKQVSHTMERIAQEGRKCGVYGLFSSQVWLVDSIGKTSALRDCLTSSYVHKIKPKQANLLLQDREEAEKVKKYVKQAGDVLFCPVNDKSAVCKIPYTTEADMKMVAEMLQHTQIYPQNRASRGLGFDKIGERYEDIPSEPKQLKSEISASSLPKSEDVLNMLDARWEAQAEEMSKNEWQRQMAELCDIAPNTLKNIMLGHNPITEQTLPKLVQGLHLYDHQIS